MLFDHPLLACLPLWARRKAEAIFHRLIQAGCSIQSAAAGAIAKTCQALNRKRDDN